MTEIKNKRYLNSKIYKLFDEEGYYYYGSTCFELRQRLFNHKKMAKRSPSTKIYTIFTYERFMNDEIKIVEIFLKNKK